MDTIPWRTYELATHWVFEAPEGAVVMYQTGYDSTPGNITLKAAAIRLGFDCGFGLSTADTCSMDTELQSAKKTLARGAYKFLDKADTVHNTTIDTINGRIALVIMPKVTGRGVMKVDI